MNIILEKNIDGAILSGRFGGYDEGGGRSGRISFADSVSAVDDKLNIVFGIQPRSNPVWGYQRDLTSQFNTNGYNGAPQLASRDWLVYSPFAAQVPRPGQLRQRQRWLRRQRRNADTPWLRRRENYRR